MFRNKMQLKFDAISQNEGFARMTIGAFIAQLNPTIYQLADIKTAVSEAVTNAIIHAYPEKEGEVELNASIEGTVLTVEIIDHGVGIADIDKARQPFYTTAPEEERSGMGFMVMESFMDSLEVTSKVGEGTRVLLRKNVETYSAKGAV